MKYYQNIIKVRVFIFVIFLEIWNCIRSLIEKMWWMSITVVFKK
jgi:hypothetical protein